MTIPTRPLGRTGHAATILGLGEKGCCAPMTLSRTPRR